MHWMTSAIITGAIAFAATNVDDLFVLMLFFAQAERYLKSQIYIGQYLGFTAIVVCSLPGFFGGLLIPQTWIGLLGIIPIVLGVRALLNREDEAEIQGVNARSNALTKFLLRFISPQTLSVASVTFANGGDNIATYIPLFASIEPERLIIVLVTFFALVAVWCSIASWLASHRAIEPVLVRYNRILVPLVLIGLGIYILIENEVWKIFA